MLFGRTAIAELGMIPSTMHSAVLLKESLPEASLMVSECVNLEEKMIVNQKHPEQTMIIERQLPTQLKQKLVKLLRDNADIFAWEYSDMTGIPRTLKIGNKIFVIEHELNDDKKITPKQQKKRDGPRTKRHNIQGSGRIKKS
ncbi:hypothetical protein Tco_0161315 [Tanacetum coccineum]